MTQEDWSGIGETDKPLSVDSLRRIAGRPRWPPTRRGATPSSAT